MNGSNWFPNATAVILRASQLRATPGLTRWSLLDKFAATEFLREIGYKKPFFVPTSGTIAMLFEKHPEDFVHHPKQVWLTDMSAYRPDIPVSVVATHTWLGDGTSLASAFQNPSLLLDERAVHDSILTGNAEPRTAFFQLLVPDIRFHFGSLLE
jgi:hypothetical protein